MRLGVVDCETWPIRRAQKAPRLVAYGWATDDQPVQITHRDDADAYRTARHVIDNAERLVNHNISFDCGVLGRQWPALIRPIFDAHAQRRVRCTYIRAQLEDLSAGTFWQKGKGFDLAAVFHRAIARAWDLDSSTPPPKKDKEQQTSYADLDGVPVAWWPERAREYLTSDIEMPRQLDTMVPEQANEIAQQQAYWALHLGSMRGLRTDPARVAHYSVTCQRTLLEVNEEARKFGLVRRDGTSDDAATRALVELNYGRLTGEAAPRTAAGVVQANDVAVGFMLHHCPEHDPVYPQLRVLQARGKAQTAIRYLPLLEGGTVHPIMPGVNPILANGRVSYRASEGQARGAGLQQLPRRGLQVSGVNLPGVRSCFVPRPGYCFLAADLSQGELRALGQVQLDWFGRSRLADAFRQGVDPHTVMAAELLGISIEQAVALKQADTDKRFKDVRRLAKEINFGFPGGMGAARFVARCRKYEIWDVTEKDAWNYKNRWKRLWQMDAYYAHVRGMLEATWIPEGRPNWGGRIAQPRSGRVRGGLQFTDACNTFFSGPVADGTKSAAFWASYLAWCDPTSPLFGARLVWFLHDELGFEVPLGREHAAQKALEALMIRAMRDFTPDVPAEADSRIMYDCWEDK